MHENHAKCVRLGSSTNNKRQHSVGVVHFIKCVCMHCNLVEIIKGRGREVG